MSDGYWHFPDLMTTGQLRPILGDELTYRAKAARTGSDTFLKWCTSRELSRCCLLGP